MSDLLCKSQICCKFSSIEKIETDNVKTKLVRRNTIGELQ